MLHGTTLRMKNRTRMNIMTVIVTVIAPILDFGRMVEPDARIAIVDAPI